MSIFILITGASSGIGRAVALRLSEANPLILGGTNAEHLEETRNLCQNSDRHLVWNCNLSAVDQIYNNLLGFLMKHDIKVGGFIHSAGINKIQPMHMVSLADMQQIMSVNFFSAFEIAKLLVKRSANGSFLKSILFISSVSSLRGVRGSAAYCASKGALDAMMRSLALELGPRIRVNSILPGAIQTPMTQRDLDDAYVRDQVNQKQILGVGNAKDIADCVEFIVSSKAGLITGQQFIVDGGFTIG